MTRERTTAVGNLVTEVVAALGSVAAAAEAAGTTPTTLYGYERTGVVRRADVCLALAEAAAPKLGRDVLELANDLAGRTRRAKRRR